MGDPESDWLLSWVWAGVLGDLTLKIGPKLHAFHRQAHSTSHTTSLVSQLFYSNLSFYGPPHPKIRWVKLFTPTVNHPVVYGGLLQ